MLAATGKRVVGKSRVWSDKNIVLKRNSVPDLNAAFYCHVVADDYVVFNENTVTNITVRADLCTWQYVCECPDPRAFANVCCFYQRLRMLKMNYHEVTAL